MSYRYEACCVDTTGELINDMRDEAEEISYEELVAACEGVEEWAVSKGYDTDPEDGLVLWEDWHVDFNRSTFDGRPCFFIQWSGIEFIWTQEGSGEGFGYGSR